MTPIASTNASPGASPPPLTYEQSIARLDAITGELGRPDVALDRALALFDEGIATLRTAHSALERAEAQLAVLVESASGEFEVRPAGGSSS